MCRGVRLKAGEIKLRMRAQLVFGSERGIGQAHFLETGVAAAPERATPDRIHGIDAAVFFAQPALERFAGAVAVIEEGARFIVHLPAPDTAVVAVTLGHGGHQPRHEGFVFRIGQ